MKKILFQKRFSLFSAFLLISLFIITTLFAPNLFEHIYVRSDEYYYELAVRDSMTIESNEIKELAVIKPDSPDVTFNKNGEVLLITWHKYPESYLTRTKVTLTHGFVWSFTDKEIINWYHDEGKKAKTFNLRLKQLLGLPPDSNKTHFTAFWVSPDYIMRPAYTKDITINYSDTKFFSESDEEFTNWFNSNIINSYFEGSYPWTRLGYTYDWSRGSDEYGISEFIIEKGTTVTIAFTCTTEEFKFWLENQSANK